MSGIPTRKALIKAGIRIVIHIPLERTMRDIPFLYFWQIARQGYDLVPRTYGRTDMNRNNAGQYLLENKKYTHVLMLDSDHIHGDDIAGRLGRHVIDNPDRLVVAGLNFRRTQPFDPCMFLYDETGKLRPPLVWPQGCLPVDATGTGCVLISRKVFETLPRPWFAYGYNWAEENIYPSEDMYFAQSCRANGIQQWVDTETTSPHNGDNWIHAEHFRRFMRDNPEYGNVLGQDNEHAAKVLAGKAEKINV